MHFEKIYIKQAGCRLIDPKGFYLYIYAGLEDLKSADQGQRQVR